MLLYTAQRGGDVVRMRRADIKADAITLTQEKTGTGMTIPIHSELRRAIKAGPSNRLHLVGDKFGRPIKRDALTKLIKSAAHAAGLPPECVPHGLRKASMRRLAEAGGTARELMGLSGHKSIREVERYTERSDQVGLAKAAMAKMRTKRHRGLPNLPRKTANPKPK